jgi:HTH-type transcriptional regulator / antitoxin HipB
VEKSGKHDPDRDNPVASFVRMRRRANRLTQRELAELAGVGLRFVSELERGKPTARIGTVDAVLRVFGKRLGVIDLPREREQEP